MPHSSFSRMRARLRRSFRMFTWGGEWAIPLPVPVKRNLSWFFYDGLFASASDNIIITYLVLYLLALGATRAQIGLMSSFSNLTAAALLLPGALLVERVGHRKELTVLFGGILARVMILVLALLPLFISGPTLVLIAIILSITRDAFGNLAFPAWMSMTGTVVPIEGRGRYFGSRNFIMGIAGMLVIFLVGELITRMEQPASYQVAMGLAVALGFASTFSFWKLRDPRGGVPDSGGVKFSLKAILADMRTRPVFVNLCIAMTLWNFSLNIAGPFFNVYMVQDLSFTASMVGLTSIATTISSLLFQRKFGALADRWGPRKVQLVSMLLIPLLPLGWMFITRFWQAVALNIFGGIIWGAFSLASFNFLLSLTPEAQRARYSALYQVVVTLALAGGAAFGSWVVTRWGYQAVFLYSAIGRVIAGGLFLKFVPEVLKPRTATVVQEE